MENPSGDSAEDGGAVGNLGLTDTEEDHIVAFLAALTDGYFQNVEPSISLQPADVTTCLGASVSLTAGASGTPTMFYQWYRGDQMMVNSGEISGTASATL